jgi:hypothetical protein
MTSIWDGIVIGGAGGAIAGLTVSFIRYLHNKALEWTHKRRIYNWLKLNTSIEAGNEYRSTRAIASWNNLTEDRVRYICSIHTNIYLSTGDREDMWSLYERGDRSVYEKRGVITLGKPDDFRT